MSEPIATRRPWIVSLYPLDGEACRVFGWQACLAHGFGTYPRNYSAPGPHPSTIRFVRFAHLSTDGRIAR